MNYTQMTEIERYQIKAYLKVGYTQPRCPQQAIASELDRAPSTASRELKRNTGLRGYRPQQAQRLAGERKQRHGHAIITDATWQ